MGTVHYRHKTDSNPRHRSIDWAGWGYHHPTRGCLGCPRKARYWAGMDLAHLIQKDKVSCPEVDKANCSADKAMHQLEGIRIHRSRDKAILIGRLGAGQSEVHTKVPVVEVVSDRQPGESIVVLVDWRLCSHRTKHYSSYQTE